MGKINETTKIIAKTGPTGEMDFEKVDADVAQRLNGQTVTDTKGNRQTIKDTGKTVTEGEMEQSDYIQLGTQLAKATAAALKEHGDEVAMLTLRGSSPEGCTVHVQYKPNEQDQAEEDDFKFSFSGDKISLGGQEICQVSQISGTTSIQKDLVQDAITKFIDGHSNVDLNASEEMDNQGSVTDHWNPDAKQAQADADREAERGWGVEDELNEDLLLGFRDAVKKYRENPKDRESIKELFRQSRNFPGDDIQHKFQAAVNAFKASEDPAENVADELQVVSPQDPRIETEPEQGTCVNDESNLCLNMSLFIRLLEYAHEEVKGDVDLHFVAENLQNICAQKGCASMEDYEEIISESNSKKEVDENWYDPKEDLEGEVEFSHCPDPDDIDEHYDEDGDWVEPAGPSRKLADIDIAQRAHRLDQILAPDAKQVVMNILSDICNAPESLDDSVEDYINNTIPNITLEQFKEAVNRMMLSGE